MSFDAGLAARIADTLHSIGERSIRQKNVFGGRGFMDGKRAFVIVSDDAIIAKVAPDDYAAALAEPGVAPFAPMGEKAMGTWVVVDAEVIADDPELTDWLKRALRGVRR